MRQAKNSILIAAAALALSLSFSPLPLHFLSYIALVPLFLIIETRDRKGSFWTGFVFGFLYSLFLLFWLLFLEVPPVIKAWLIAGYVILSAYIGFYFATFSLLTKWLGFFWSPFILVALEFIRSVGEIGFPWGVLGYTQVAYLPMIQLASLFGIWGVSFWLVIVNVLFCKFIKEVKTGSGWIRPLVILLGVLVTPLIYGLARIGRNEDDKIRVAVVQPNIDPNLKSTLEMKLRMFEVLREDADQVKSEGVDLIILPETALPVNIEREKLYYNMTRRVADSSRVAILTGSLLSGHSRWGYGYYNGAILFVPDSGIVTRYKKIHLVPFSEKIPYRRQIQLFRKLDFGGGDFTPGEEYVVFKIKGKRFATLICFESIFGDLTRHFVNQGLDFLVNITNDGWFGNTPGPYQHAEMAVVRAVENRMPLVRCANTGISMIVDQYGRILSRTRIFTQALLVADVPMGRRKSLYTRLGDFLPMLAIMLIVAVTIIKIFRSKYPDHTGVSF